MKKLFFLPLLLIACTPMEYKYEYKVTDSEGIRVRLDVVDTLRPNVYVIECSFQTDLKPINSISLVVNYENITCLDQVTINDKLYINEYDDLNNLGGTFYYNNGHQMRYSFATVQDVEFSNEFIFREIIEVHAETTLDFSKVPDDVEFTDKNAKPYPLKLQSIKFTKNE